MDDPFVQAPTDAVIRVTTTNVGGMQCFFEDQDDRKHRAVRRLQRERARLHEEKAAKMNEMNALMARKATLEQEIRAVDVLIGRVNGAIEVELDK